MTRPIINPLKHRKVKALDLADRRTLAGGVLMFRRDWYLCTEQEMRERWNDPYIMKGLSTMLKREEYEAFQHDFNGHLPFWEYVKDFIFTGTEIDPNTQKRAPTNDFRLYPPLHRDIICRRIQDYMLHGDPEHVGLAIFIMRFGLKTGIGCIGLTSWLLTRHRVLFDDFTTIRIIHDLKEEAIERAAQVKMKHQHCKPLTDLYPEVALPRPNWMKEQFWDLQGRAEADAMTLDAQVSAFGVKSAMQGRHPRYTIIDDPESDRHRHSPAAVKETKSFFKGFQYSEQLGMSRATLLGTFYNPDSVNATIVKNAELAEAGQLAKSATWDVIKIPATRDYDTPNALLTYPLRLDTQTLEKMRLREIAENGNDLNWHMQMQLNLKASRDYMFNMDMWQMVNLEKPQEEFEEDMVEALSKATVIVQADYAGKDQSTAGRGDDNAIFVVQYPIIDGKVYMVIVDGYADDTSELDRACEKTLQMAATYDAWWICAEESVAHKVVGSRLTNIAARMGLQYHQSFDGSRQTGNIITLTPRQSQTRGIANISSWKMGRMQKFQAVWNSGQVYINSAMDSMLIDKLRMQIQPFPFIKHDDLIDAISMTQDERMFNYIPKPKIMATPLRNRRKRPKTMPVQVGRYSGLTMRVPSGGRK